MVLVHGLLVIPDSRRFLSVEVTRWVDPCTMGESRLTGGVEISHRVVRRQVNRHGESHDTSPKISDLKEMVQAYRHGEEGKGRILNRSSNYRFNQRNN